MNASNYKKLIIKQCKAIGTYDKNFDIAISTLAGILERRDNMESEYANIGCPALGEKGMHPAIRAIESQNAQALSYLRELGLTAKGLKAIADKQAQTQDKLGEILSKL